MRPGVWVRGEEYERETRGVGTTRKYLGETRGVGTTRKFVSKTQKVWENIKTCGSQKLSNFLVPNEWIWKEIIFHGTQCENNPLGLCWENPPGYPSEVSPEKKSCIYPIETIKKL